MSGYSVISEVFIGDPVNFRKDIYACWLTGLSVDEAAVKIKQGTDDLKETVEPIYSDEGKEIIAPEVTLQSGETVGAADSLFLITKYLDKRGRYCFRMDEILDPETVSSVAVFGETFSVES